MLTVKLTPTQAQRLAEALAHKDGAGAVLARLDPSAIRSQRLRVTHAEARLCADALTEAADRAEAGNGHLTSPRARKNARWAVRQLDDAAMAFEEAAAGLDT